MNFFNIPGLDDTNIIDNNQSKTTPKKRTKRATKPVIEEAVVVEEKPTPKTKKVAKKSAPKEIESTTLSDLKTDTKELFHFVEPEILAILKKAKIEGQIVKVYGKYKLYVEIKRVFEAYGGEYKKGDMYFMFPYSPVLLITLLGCGQNPLLLIEQSKVNGEISDPSLAEINAHIPSFPT